jgi:integrase
MNYKLSRLSDCDGDLSQRWYVYYLFRDPDSGKWIRFSKWISSRLVTRTQRYEAAKDLRRSIDLKLRQGWNPFIAQNRGLTTVQQSVDYFLKIKERQIRYRTLISYRSHLKRYSDWLSKKKYDKISVESFNYYMASEFMDHVTTSSRLSNRTWNNYLQTLRCFFNFLQEKEYITLNPFFKIHELPTEQTELIAFSRDELDIVSKNLPGHNHDLYVVALMIFSGFLRPQEIVRMQIRHLRNIGNILSIPGNISKNKKTEVISVPKQLRDEIDKMNLDFPADWYVFGLHMKRAKKPVAPTRIAEAWRIFANKHDLRKNIYGLKHTGNGMALAGGANARDLQMQNRHSSLEETQKYLERVSRVPSEKFVTNFPRL